MKLAGLLKDAFEKAGVALPETQKKKPPPAPAQQKKKVFIPVPGKEKPKGKQSGGKSKKKRNPQQIEAHKGKSVTITPNGTCITRWTSAEPALEKLKLKPPSSVNCKPEGNTSTQASVDDYTITATADAKVIWSTFEKDKSDSLLELSVAGFETHLNNRVDDKSLYLGLDFGTSTLKAVICDKEREITYAVSFRRSQGIQSYLLPCRIGLDEQGYNLEGRGQVFQDLKLALLASPDSSVAQLPVVAFLALALRRVRGWLLSNHGETYAGPILWDLAMGLPVANRCDEKTAQLYRRLGIAAWIASSERQLNPESIRKVLERAAALSSGVEPVSEIEDIEVRVEPEIAAQIYGFVSSGAYDPNASNIYLMVDVGAGTLDASVFRVERKKGQRKDSLVIFKTTVEPFGVMNQHKKRMEWLSSAFLLKLPLRSDLQESVQSISLMTDAVKALPELLDDYFSGVKIQFQGRSPDQIFYAAVKRQVVQDTYIQVANEKLLDKQQMKDMPMFLCGGGSRSAFYGNLKQDLQSSPGFSWVGVKPKPLQKPSGLVAPGLLREDYDRLSVAFGLSQLRLENLIYEVPPLIDQPGRVDFRDRYIEN